MIRMIQSTSASHAKSYFSQALQKSDYYIDDQELQGQFRGRLVDRLGLETTATKDAFFALCENQNPVTGEALTQRKKDERTIGYDINFHCPKSVSLIHVLSKDSHIMDAFQQSVHETMLHIEADSMARVRVGNAHEDRKTGSLIWAEFTHQTARPVDGSVPDPHLHSHCFTFNATWDDVEGKMKACQFRDIKRDMPYYQARFHKTLSDKLIDLGYQIRRTDKSFEIEGVPRGIIDLFSKRTNEIGEFAKEHGITDPKQLSELAARTRSRKDQGLGMAELKAEWRKQIQEYTEQSGEQGGAIRYAPAKDQDKMVALDCVNHSLRHTFERFSVMDHRRILATAYRQSIGNRSIELDDVTNTFHSDKNIIHVEERNRTFCTTKEVLKEEKRMVDLAKQGQGKFNPIYSEVPKIKNEGQAREAISHVLTTHDQVSIIRGVAGSGKTTMLTEAVDLMQQAGINPLVVAPTAEASRGVLVSEGFKNADTVAKLLVDKEMQERLKGQALIVDEGGLLGTTQATALLELAIEKNARLIFVGDTRQHASVVRGDALRILNTVGGIHTAEMSKIYRQRNVEYRSAVQDLSNGNVKGAFTKLDDMGAITTIDPLKPNVELVDDYLTTVKAGKSALIVSPTHEQGSTVTAQVRSRLRSAGLIGKKELKAEKLTTANLTEAEKADWRNFKQGQIIQFSQNAPQFKRGSAWTVKDSDDKAVILTNKAGETKSLPLTTPASYEVYNRSEIGLSKGDKIRITKNSFDAQDKRLNNGTSLEVLSVNKAGLVVLMNPTSKAKYTLNSEFGHLDHAYCTTSHSSQGKTVDEVFISQPASTFTATNAKQFYVSVSRGRDKARIYTDDKEALLENALQAGDRKSALELVGKNDDHIDYVHQKERTNQISRTKQDNAMDREKGKPIDLHFDYGREI